MDPIVGSIVRSRRLILLCGAVVGALYVSFKKYSNDRVILCEAIGVSIFMVGISAWAISGFSDSSLWIFVVSGIAAVFLGLLAVYFGVVQWLRRKKQRS
ncbi:MAG: hypothetical protein ACRD33_01510 [Candidatus Acidiferrales bacterium]